MSCSSYYRNMSSNTQTGLRAGHIGGPCWADSQHFRYSLPCLARLRTQYMALTGYQQYSPQSTPHAAAHCPPTKHQPASWAPPSQPVHHHFLGAHTLRLQVTLPPCSIPCMHTSTTRRCTRTTDTRLGAAAATRPGAITRSGARVLMCSIGPPGNFLKSFSNVIKLAQLLLMKWAPCCRASTQLHKMAYHRQHVLR